MLKNESENVHFFNSHCHSWGYKTALCGTSAESIKLKNILRKQQSLQVVTWNVSNYQTTAPKTVQKKQWIRKFVVRFQKCIIFGTICKHSELTPSPLFGNRAQSIDSGHSNPNRLINPSQPSLASQQT